MRTIFVLFDSLNRQALGCYGGSEIATPNFDRFAARSMVFDNHFVGSLPCMPARRDMHAGRLNFMHRSWGPLEPFDNSFARILRDSGTYTHLVSDHLHYFEDGGGGFHTRFNSFDFIRGQEYDPWVAMVEPPIDRFRQMYSDHHYEFERGDRRLQHMINREQMQDEAEFPGPKCFASAFEFLNRNRTADDWLLMLECFDPHEPFHAPKRFRDAYESGYDGKILDWPHYARVTESETEMREIRANYAALLAMCDEYFGRLLDYMDEHDMWKDTALVLTTDHGFMLGEHEWWGKCRMPYYEEIAHIPLMIHDPRHPAADGTRNRALTQTMDLMPTLLGLHGMEAPAETTGVDLAGILAGETTEGRDLAVFGLFGGPLGVTDGDHVLYYYPDDLTKPGLREYTLMPTHMLDYFTVDELKTATLHEGFDFTKELPVLSIAATADAKRIPNNDGHAFDDIGTRLFNIVDDPKQERPLENGKIQDRLLAGLRAVLTRHDTPREVFEWYGI